MATLEADDKDGTEFDKNIICESVGSKKMKTIALFSILLLATLATAAALDDGPTVTLYEIQQGVCGEVLNFPSKYAKLAEKFDKNLKEGSCESVGYTEFVKNTTKKTPIGTFTVEEFKKPSAAALKDGPTVTLYEIQQGVCGEVLNFPSKYAKLAEKFDKNLKEGSCESVGYTEFVKNTTKEDTDRDFYCGGVQKALVIEYRRSTIDAEKENSSSSIER